MRWIVSIALLVACGSGGGGSPWKQQDVPAAGLSVLTVWASGDNDVWLGGTATWHFDGAAWTQSSANSAVDFWGFSSTDVWAINESQVFRWNGSTWTEMEPTTGLTFEALWRIWGSSGSDIWIANQDNSRVYRYNGTSWSVTTLQFVMADALWGSGPNDIWLAGTTDLYHYTGTWTKYDANDEPPSIRGLWGFGPDDVWAAGSFDALSHWDGTNWTADPEVEEDYDAIWGNAPDNLYAVGGNGYVAHYNGSSWSESRELDVRTNFTMVHGSSASNVWATAIDLDDQKALVYRFEP